MKKLLFFVILWILLISMIGCGKSHVKKVNVEEYDYYYGPERYHPFIFYRVDTRPFIIHSSPHRVIYVRPKVVVPPRDRPIIRHRPNINRRPRPEARPRNEIRGKLDLGIKERHKKIKRVK